MNKFVRNIFVLILIIVFIIAFSTSYSSLSIDNLAYILSIGIDKADDNNLLVSFQFSNTPSSTDFGTKEKTPTIIDSVNASSLSTAVNLMNSYMGKELNISHCKVIIFSEELAAEGISDEIYTLMNDTQIRPTANIIISKCSAKKYMEETTPELENLISKYYEIFTNSGKYTGFKPDATIGKFFNSILCETCEPYAILGELTSEDVSINHENDQNEDNYHIRSDEVVIEGENGSESVGLAAFKNDKLVGELSPLETTSFLAITNNIDRFLISVPDPEDPNNYIDIYLTPEKFSSVHVNTSTPSPYIKVNTKFKGRIYSMNDNAKYLDNDVLKSISEACNDYLESVFSDYLYKTSKDFKSDINGFGKFALGNFFTEQDFTNYNWAENYKNAFFEVNVDTSIKSSMLITET